MQIKEWGEPNNITGTLNPTWEVQTTHDNKVVVHNKMYSRSDVEKLINSAFKAGVFQGMSIFNQKDLDKWMQDNL
ncbi:MAG: hypothetical protein IPJ01_10265 [Micavibrio sp.]|nr:hypothetical protein [Micavibrio sp.]